MGVEGEFSNIRVGRRLAFRVVTWEGRVGFELYLQVDDLVSP